MLNHHTKRVSFIKRRVFEYTERRPCYCSDFRTNYSVSENKETIEQVAYVNSISQ